MPSFCRNCSSKNTLIFHPGTEEHWTCEKIQTGFLKKIRLALASWIAGKKI